MYLLLIPFGGIMASCDDWFTILPQSEMVAEDFWKDEQDVLSSLGACYRAMNEEGFMNKLIVWGEVRSDNVISGNKSDGDIDRILEANITASNGNAKWGEMYTVINICNTLIKNAPMVRERDADFSEIMLNQYLAEAKTIRAFCYFNLVRTFNRVPYIDEPYLDDTRPFKVPQSSCEDILNALITDLKAYENAAAKDFDLQLSYTKGRITQKAVWALMADMYLWLGDYQNCVTYCDKILESKENPLILVGTEGSSLFVNYSNEVFYTGNSDESIWEIQFNDNPRNDAVTKFYGGTDEAGYLSAFDLEEGDFFVNNDLRRAYGYVESGKFSIKKYVARCLAIDYANITSAYFDYGSRTNNWIVYRLPDVYLMKAEALTEMGGAADLEEAVRMVSYTYDRAHPDLEEGSLVGQYVSQTDIRELVFDERQREFLYEGKRYFDIVRRVRRNPDDLSTIIETYLMRKYRADQDLDEVTIERKLNDKDAIYMPIHEEELRLNSLLEQNRFYDVSDDIIKK